jgi:hypothetical protein
MDFERGQVSYADFIGTLQHRAGGFASASRAIFGAGRPFRGAVVRGVGASLSTVCAPELVCRGGRHGEQDLRLDNRAVLSRSSEYALAFGTPIHPAADQQLREQSNYSASGLSPGLSRISRSPGGIV